jgi:hypothetical protein
MAVGRRWPPRALERGQAAKLGLLDGGLPRVYVSAGDRRASSPRSGRTHYPPRPPIGGTINQPTSRRPFVCDWNQAR